MRIILIAIVVLCAGGLHSQSLEEARAAAQAEVDKFTKEFPEAADFTKLSRTWASGKNGWDDFLPLMDDASKLTNQDWYWKFYGNDGAPASDPELINFLKAGLADTEEIAAKAAELRKFDCIVPPEQNVDVPLASPILTVFNLLSSRALALASLAELDDATKLAALNVQLALKFNMGGYASASGLTSVVRSLAWRTALDVSVRDSDREANIGSILALKGHDLTVRDVMLGECSLTIAIIKRELENDQRDAAQMEEFLTAAREHVAALVALLRVTPDGDLMSDRQVAEKFVAAFEESTPEKAETSSVARVVQFFLGALIAQDMRYTALRVRQKDRPIARVASTMELTEKLLPSHLRVTWVGNEATLSLDPEHPLMRLWKERTPATVTYKALATR